MRWNSVFFSGYKSGLKSLPILLFDTVKDIARVGDFRLRVLKLKGKKGRNKYILIPSNLPIFR